MAVFREFIDRHDFVEQVLNEFDKGGDAVPERQASPISGKVWSGKKADILDMWHKLRPDIPLIITPMDTDADKDSYGEDGIRITGTWNFIAGVLARLKDLLGYENPETKLRLVFRGIESQHDARPDRNSFVFYLNLDRRSKGRPGRKAKNPFSPQPLNNPFEVESPVEGI
jgi:hypothetical protein